MLLWLLTRKDSTPSQQQQHAEEDIDENDIVPLATLRLIRSNPDILASLSNRHLRQMLQEIDESDNPVEKLKSSMMIPIFLEFADACLEVCGVNILEGAKGMQCTFLPYA